MKTFEGVAFRGTFRDYQQHVLSGMDAYIEDRKVHIVAAPGSGKTILGLEIIRRLGGPALILSPSVVIRQQWSQRFEERFLPQGGDIGDYVSCSLRDMRLLTSVTYQSLHSAWTRQTEERDEDAEDGAEEGCAQTDYADFDLVGAVRAAGIKTICLDEAHHLKAEWQRALEGFIAAVQGEMFTVALTATPPYDSQAGEWKRYIAVCGEIDEEISVPELVQQRTLCPHQDYIYFNYPTREEVEKVKAFREQAAACTRDIIHGEVFGEALRGSGVLTNYRTMEELLTENAKGFIAVLSLAQERGEEVPSRLARLLVPGGKLPPAKLAFAETAFQFIIDNPLLFSPDAAQELRKTLSKGGFYEKRKVGLQYTDRLQRMLLSSNGKLDSICRIVEAESAQLGGALRMLILTDYIRRDMMSAVGTQAPVGAIGTVSVFETVRRAAKPGMRVALLSGGLVILPDEALTPARDVSRRLGVAMDEKPIAGTAHTEVIFGGANKHKVAVVTELFEAGQIHVLVGTKALLGEGWDSPGINSLILASFVGSFVLTNQMRGRAIRTDKNNPDKTANIWHLVTIEPEMGLKALLGGVMPKDSFASLDFDTLIRRFDCFLAPSYESDTIQSGISRVSILKPPFGREGFGRINEQMLRFASQRDALKARWHGALSGSHPEVMEVTEAPPQVVPRAFVLTNLLYETVLGIILSIIIRGIASAMSATDSLLLAVSGLAVILLMGLGFKKLLAFISPRRTIETLSRCILETLRQMKAVRSFEADVDIQADETNAYIQCGIQGATLREKKLFADAVRELLTSIDNPRYLLIKKLRLPFHSVWRYSQSYACPSVIGAKQEYVDILMRLLKRKSGAFGYVYTRSEAGRWALLRCRRRSYINRNEAFVTGRKVVRSRWE